MHPFVFADVREYLFCCVEGSPGMVEHARDQTQVVLTAAVRAMKARSWQDEVTSVLRILQLKVDDWSDAFLPVLPLE